MNIEEYLPQFQLPFEALSLEANRYELKLLRKLGLEVVPKMLRSEEPLWDPKHSVAGDYEGELDSNSMRINLGKCSYPDGCYYHGTWALNVRHGPGAFVTGDGTRFEGQWCNGQRHGMGRIIYSDGECVQGCWLHDRLNGLARVGRPGENGARNVVFKDGVMVEGRERCLSGWDYLYANMSALLTLVFYGAILLGFLIDKKFLLLMLVYLIYIIWSYNHSATEYIKHLIPLSEMC